MENTKLFTGKSINLRRPSLSDWLQVKSIWEDVNTMKDVGGIHLLSEEKYKSWYKFMFADKKDENDYFLIFLNEMNKCIGEISFHQFNKNNGRAMFNIKIKNEFRKNGFGSEAMDLILNYYFNYWNGIVMEDSIWKKNENGLRNLVKYGFRNFKEDEKEIWVEITKEEWKRKRV